MSVSGYGTGVIVQTGRATFFGQLADEIAGRRVPTAFDQGINRFTWLMIRFIIVMVPAVFLINGLTKHDWLEALLFAVAVAVGLTPEMLPMIVTVNLAKGAIAMSHKKVIVKRLNAIQNFGAMDVLCTDKTGTLTQDRIILKRHLDIRGEEFERVLQYAYLNSHFQSGLKNLLDIAVLQHVELHKTLRHRERISQRSTKFRSISRAGVCRWSCRAEDGKHVLICKGAVEEIFAVCTQYELDGESAGSTKAILRPPSRRRSRSTRTVSVSSPSPTRRWTVHKAPTRSRTRADLTLLGYIAFLDPPKESAGAAIAALAARACR